jgi:branched-chain amino acid transport system substrate-binding protein
MLRKDLILAFLVATLASLAEHACAQEVVKIGIVMPMSGSFARAGRQVLAGVHLYIQQHGDLIAGKKIQLIVRDDASLPDVSKRMA